MKMKYDKLFYNCLLIIIFFTAIYWGTNYTINTKYLFGWDEIPGNDSAQLRKYLELNFGIENATFNKTDDNMTIRVSTENNSLSLELNNEKTKIDSNGNSAITSEFIVKTEYGKINVYYRPRIFNLVLMLLSVLSSILLIRIIPKYEVDDKEIKGNENLIIAYELKFIVFIIFLLFFSFEIISLVSKKDGYYGSYWIIYSIGMILMSYPSNTEDIIYVLHKLNPRSYSREVSSNWYYLFGYKIDKMFKNELLEDLRAFQRPLFYMHFLAAHSTFNSSYRGENLKKFYRGLLLYLLEKNYVAGAHAINSLSNEINEIKLLSQRERIYLFNLDEKSEEHSDVDIEFIRRYFITNLIQIDKIKLNDEKTKAYLTTGDGIFYEFDVKKENGKLNIYGKLESSSLRFEFNDLKNDSKMRIERRSILLTHITERSLYRVVIIFSSGLLSIFYIINWFGGG